MLKRAVLASGALCLSLVVNIAGQAPAGGRTTETRAAVTFHKDVQPILQKNCQSCHRPGQIGPMPLLTYQQARPWSQSIKNKVGSRQMPPWLADPRYGRFMNDVSLPQREIDTLVAWAEAGAPEGNPADAPEPVAFSAQGWLMQPDVTLELPPYDLPATGVIDWEAIAVPSPFKEDTWVTSIEMMQSEPGVVHHMCFDVVPHTPAITYNQYEWMEQPKDENGVAARPSGAPPTAGAARAGGRREGVVLSRKVGAARDDVQRRTGRAISAGANTFCWEHGLPSVDYRPLGAARLIPANSDLIVTSHYTTNGKTVVTNRPRVGFTVTRTPPANKFVAFTLTPSQDSFAIPPNDGNWKSPSASAVFKQDVLLTWFWPHMHMRGKDFTYTLEYPDGRKEIVLHVPRYDYAWELQYMTRISVPKGTKITADAHFDNSTANRGNPNPNTWVYWGQQRWEEMMAGIFGVVVDVKVNDRDITDRQPGAAGG
jgi:hypothetical protein